MRICGIQMSTESNRDTSMAKMIKLSQEAINQGASYILFSGANFD